MALGPDGNLWFTENSAKKIGKITPSGTITEYTIPPDGGNIFPESIAVGPDGALWFTTGSELGRITTSGSLTTLPAEASLLGMYAIVTGPDGNLYYSGGPDDNGYIVQQNPSGPYVRFSAPAFPGSPFNTLPDTYGLAVGVDHGIWFTNIGSGTGYLGRMSTSGAFASYAMPSTVANSVTYDIISNPADGELYFLASNPNITNGTYVVRSSTAGVMNVVTGPGGPYFDFESNLIVGPDGNIWSSTPYAVYSQPTNGGTACLIGQATGPIRALTIGSDGNVWFLEPSNNLVGRFNIPSTPLLRRAPRLPGKESDGLNKG
jgi:virginiamycin B lyase